MKVLVLLICLVASSVLCNQEAKMQKSYNEMLRIMAESEQEAEVSEMLITQIFLWTSIALVFILYFSVKALIDMPIQKSSILYAKYGTTKAQQEH